jgi:hypothetical protein
MGSSGGGSGLADDGSAMVWYLDEQGRLNVSRIVKGVSDGRMTEIVRGRGIEEGMRVIVGVNELEEESGSGNPLATGPFGRRRG